INRLISLALNLSNVAPLRVWIYPFYPDCSRLHQLQCAPHVDAALTISGTSSLTTSAPPLRPSPMRLAFIRSPPSRASSAARPRAASSDDGWVANTTTSKYASHLHDKGHLRCHISAAPSNGLHSRRSPILRVPHKSRARQHQHHSSASRAPPARPAHQARPIVIPAVPPPAPHPVLLCPTVRSPSRSRPRTHT
ncbi:hypothetical protein DFH09DRAFT_1186691, partial [Mycena vulgaris]